MKMARRVFVGLIGASAVGAAALGLPLIWRSETDLVIAVLQRRLPGLRMARAEMEGFAGEFLAYYKREGARRRSLILVGARIVEGLPDGLAAAIVPGAAEPSLRRLEEEMFSAFFLGTDFLEVHADPAAQVRFWFIPDPYVVGCANPLAQFDA